MNEHSLAIDGPRARPPLGASKMQGRRSNVESSTLSLHPRCGDLPPPSPAVRLADDDAASTRPQRPSQTTDGRYRGSPDRGSTASYGHAGCSSSGGFANFTGASSFTSIQVSPTAGWFIIDNFELTGILGFNYVHQTFEILNGGRGIGPQDHRAGPRRTELPLAPRPNVWGFLGLGWGCGAACRSSDDSASRGLRLRASHRREFPDRAIGPVQPRAFHGLHDRASAAIERHRTMLGVNTTYGLQAGYTVMW